MSDRLPTYFISHGGGPRPWLPDMGKMLHSLEVSLANMPRDIGVTPRPILHRAGGSARRKAAHGTAKEASCHS